MIEETSKSISAVIINHNGGQSILNALKALSGSTYLLDKIIVVDNASRDSSPFDISKLFPNVELIQLEKNLGLSKARNIGLTNADTDLVLLLDHDVYIQRDGLQILYDTYIKHRPAVICPRILLYPDTGTIQCDGAEPHFIGTLKLRHDSQPVAKLPSSTSEVLSCIGACMLVDRQIVLSSGGFDELYFFYFEDLEFCLRIRSLGYSIFCEPKAIVYHDRGEGTPDLSFRGNSPYPMKRVYFNIRHRLMTLFIHYKIKTLVVLSPALVLYELAIFAVVIKRGWFYSWRKAIISIIKNKNHISEKRKFVAANRKRFDRELLSGGKLPFALGFIEGRFERMGVHFLSVAVNLYWKIAKYLIG